MSDQPTDAQIAMRSAIRAEAHWLNDAVLNKIADAALAAAAVREKNPSLYYRSLEAATIERCVEVVKDIPGDGGSGLIFRQDAVAAIMALKD